MADIFSSQSSWWLECISCQNRVVNASNLRLAEVGSDGGFHLALQPVLEPNIDSIIEKRQHPKPERRKEAPFKMYCLKAGCPKDLGVYQLLEERFFYVFSSKSVRFRSVSGEVAKIRRWKESKAELEGMGIQVLQVKALWQTISKKAADEAGTQQIANEMVYCEAAKTSDEQVKKLVLDTPREYQKELFRKAMGGNAIVYLPTGSGKTLVASMVINAMLKLNPGKMAAFLVHRIPLVYQQSEYIKKQNPNKLRVEILAGDLTRFPGDREHWVQVIRKIAQKQIDVLVITAQIFYNFLSDDDATLKLSDVSCMIFDEAHNCKGNHVFAQIMRKYYDTLPDRYKPLVLGLTASPAGASTIEDTREQLTSLLTTLRARCIMPTLSNDLALHWNNPVTSYKCKPLSVTEQDLQSILVNYIQSICPMIEKLSNMEEALTKTPASSINFKGCLRTVIDRCHSKEEYVQGLALALHAMNIYSIIELNRVLGPSHAYQALKSIFRAVDDVRSPMDMVTKRILETQPSYQAFRNEMKSFSKYSLDVTSGRFTELLQIVREFVDHVRKDNTSRAIIFVHMRRTCFKLHEELNKDSVIKEKLKPLACVGHGNGLDGMQWKGEQEVVITRFHEGDCKLLVSTNVLEEGLDVPACNLVIRYDSRGTNLRALVQSRGRAARRADSRFVIMCNSEEEKQRYLELAVKEANIERAVREKVATNSSTSQASRFGCKQRAIGPDAKTTEKRKAPDAHASTSKKPRIQRPRRKACAIFTLHVSPVAQMSEGIDFLEDYFDITKFKPEGATGKEEKRLEQLNRMLRTFLDVEETTLSNEEDNKKPKSRDELSREIVRKWCKDGPQDMWLEQRGQPRGRGVNVHPLFLTGIGVGDFKDRGTFSEEWFNHCHPGGMVIFEHDLKNVSVAFQNQKEGNIFKVEFQYKEIHDCILVDTARPGPGNCSIFVSLRSVPRVLEAESSSSRESDIDEDSRLFELLEQGEISSDSDDDWSMDSDSDNEMNQTSHDASIVDKSTEEPGTEIISKLKQVTRWKRLNQIPIGRYGHHVGVFGNSLVLKIVLPLNENVWDMFRTLRCYERRICFTGIHVEQSRPSYFVSEVEQLEPKVQYAFHCLISRHPSVKQRISSRFFEELKKTDVTKCINALASITVLLEDNYFVDPEKTLEYLLQNSKSLGRRKLVVPENCVLIPRMVFTPTREIYFSHEVMEKNRVLRDFHQLDFLCLQIRDEDFSRLATHTGNISDILTRLKQLLKNGVEVGGQFYQFLGSSNSQLRSHSCWFVSPTEQHNSGSIRQWMGDFSGIRCVATLMARMGQCFSTSTDTIAVLPQETGIQFQDINDVEIFADDQTYTFSDGVGRISSNVAQKVSVLIDKKLPPSAFQIRFAGYKGVLTTDPQIQDNLIQLRPSMQKFKSEHRRLEVLQTSRPQAVYLNHQLIMLLSNLGVADEVFLRHQEKMLDSLAYMMTNEDEANQRLSSAIRTGINYKALSEVGVCLTTEPFFRSLLCALYREKIHGLLSKARILLPVTEARLMMGVMDETGRLNSGQVFVQYTGIKSEGDENFVANNKTVVKGKIVVTRNPCLHPGDVRQLEAVDVPDLRHLVDCVVFPSKGARPHPNEMAGGDLDGDLYFVCWGKDLLPTKSDFAPMNYKAPKKKEELGPITLNHMTEFISEYIKHDQLGIIDNTHKAQADAQGTGVESAICLQLAEIHSLAVDAPKTGLWQEVPVAARLREYPDFMMKSDKPSYPSQKILGKLYRECKNFQESMNFRPPRKTGHVDSRFLAQGFEEYVESARETIAEYTEHIENVLNLYGIQTEEELMSGCFYKLQKKLGRERQQIADVVRRLMTELRTIFRRAFFVEFQRDSTPLTSLEVTTEMQKKASAWYYVAYQSEQGMENSEQKSKHFIGFPWIVDDVLVTIPLVDQGSPKQNISERNAYATLENSLGEFFAKQSQTLMKGYEHRLQVKSFINDAIKENSRITGVVMFGSSATLFFEDTSDIDLCVVPYNESGCLLQKDALKLARNISQPDQMKLLRKLEPHLRRVYNGVHLVRAKVPIFRLAGLKNKEFGSKLCSDLCANPDGFLKAMVVSWYIHNYPPLLPLLRMLIQWGRDSDLVSKREGCFINTNVLVFMLLSFCVRAGWVDEPAMDDIRDDVENIGKNKIKDQELISKWENTLMLLKNNSQNTPESTGEQNPDDADGMENIEECQHHHLKLGPRNTPISHVLLEFFRRHQTLLDSSIPEAFVGILGEDQFQSLLGEGDSQLLHDQMQRAYHILALHCDVTVLLEVCSSKSQVSWHLTDQLSAWIAGSENHYSKLFSDKSGAKVRIRPRIPGLGTNLLLEASGTAVALGVLETILDDKSASLIAQPFSCLGMCFVSEANVMIFEGSQSDNDPVNLVPYYGRSHPHHDYLVRHVPLLGNAPLNTSIVDPEERSFRIFFDKLLCQLEVVARDYTPIVHGGILEFNVHFGRLYTFHVPRSLTEETDPTTVKAVQISLKRGFESKAACLMSLQSTSPTKKLFRLPFKRRKNRKAELPQATKDGEKTTRKNEKKSPKHSFFTNIPKGCVASITKYLEGRGFAENPNLGSPYFLVTVNADDGRECDITYDSDIRPKYIRSPKLRWFVTDVKRQWQARSTVGDREFDPEMLNGSECDLRLMVRSFENFPPSAVDNLPQKKFLDILKPKAGQQTANGSSYPFLINLEYKNNLHIIRHHVEQRVFTNNFNSVGQDEFLASTTVSFDEVDEYSRLKINGRFESVFKRFEMTIQPQIPANWTSRVEMEKFAMNIWTLANEIARQAYQ